MRELGPGFFAWCDEPERLDALAATLSALIAPGALIRVQTDEDFEAGSVDEALAIARARFGGQTSARVSFRMMLSGSKRALIDIWCHSEERERQVPHGPLTLNPWGKQDFLSSDFDLAWGRGPRSIQVEAVVASQLIRDDLEDLLVRFCAPDASGRIPTGACTHEAHWNAPVDMCATYNAKAEELGRDLALSWVHLHDKESVPRIAGMSLQALHARVDAAPRGARVAMKGKSERSRSLSRETVLKALAAPPSALLDALEASAAPDDAWRAAAPRATAILDLTRQISETGEGPPTWPVCTSTYGHIHFVKKHPPFHVRRLPSGGVVLATHPYCSLWPLWANALCALGLMS
ncbi:hypothetical protein SOCE26_096630 [Sorangium cellulosum]|uniref:Uncharacterized protein n=1 Tax=Sorangium cellulosum TaxID=56 RepID=A0A2L0F9B9_SORCE|nr:hypothetical protein [Sorangium cellulosum]AUX48133.1 hypothetical protein SOCE26_096630 [Sorangium cellulosum]